MHYMPYLRGLYGAIGIPLHRYRVDRESGSVTLMASLEPHDFSAAALKATERYALEHELAAGDYEVLVSPFSLGAVTLSDNSCVVLGPLNYARRSDKAPESLHIASPQEGAAEPALAELFGMKIRVANLWLMMIGQIELRQELASIEENELYQSVERLVPPSLKNIAQEVKLHAPHNQYRYELAIMDAVRQGDVDKVERAFTIPLQGKFGVLGPTPLRSMQNHVHNLNSTVSRSAISVGVLPEKAYALSDKFFMAAEHCQTVEQCIELRVMCAKAFATLVREYRQSLEGTRPPLVHNAILLISRLIYNRCTVQDLAERLQVSSAHLERVFKQSMQVTLCDYIMGEKIKLAQELLRDTNERISAIAHILSFSDSAHFSHCFKRLTGLSPRQYRNATLSHNQG